MHIRQDHPPLSGRDHLAYRGAFVPVKDTIDGDLCEQFSQVHSGLSACTCVMWLALRLSWCAQMPLDKQRSIAEQLDRTPGEVLKKCALVYAVAFGCTTCQPALLCSAHPTHRGWQPVPQTPAL